MMLIAVCHVGGCSTTPADSQAIEKDCTGEVSRNVREAPEKEYLHTLDGQQVRLQDFFSQCQDNAPDCILFAKFYLWENEVMQVVSRTESGPVEGQIQNLKIQ